MIDDLSNNDNVLISLSVSVALSVTQDHQLCINAIPAMILLNDSGRPFLSSWLKMMLSAAEKYSPRMPQLLARGLAYIPECAKHIQGGVKLKGYI
jgi:hypothetical protein